MSTSLNRRALLTSATALPLALPLAAQAGREAGSDGFTYEITRSETEWRAMLDEETYGILRLGDTEPRKSSDLWQETRSGTYHCRGCALHVFSSEWQVPLDKGWVFFQHSVPNAVMTGIDGPVREYGMSQMGDDQPSLVEIHCRRCGSHLGHYLFVALQNVHCINGKALEFRPTES
jgi:peptide-methionine (R)-S-oxide reductase